MKNNKTRKLAKKQNNMKGAGVFDFFKSTFTGDSKYCILNNGTIKCALCTKNIFMMRNGTIGKSKLGNMANDIVFGEDANAILDISITCYFCSNCGNAIFIRDEKQKSETVYKNMVMPILTDALGKPLDSNQANHLQPINKNIGQPVNNPMQQDNQQPVDDKRI